MNFDNEFCCSELFSTIFVKVFCRCKHFCSLKSNIVYIRQIMNYALCIDSFAHRRTLFMNKKITRLQTSRLYSGQHLILIQFILILSYFCLHLGLIVLYVNSNSNVLYLSVLVGLSSFRHCKFSLLSEIALAKYNQELVKLDK